MALVLDTGPIVALLEPNDPAHQRCVAMVEALGERLVVPFPVLVEVDYWMRKLRSLDTWYSFVQDLAGEAYELVALTGTDLLRAAQLERDYADLRLGLADASVIALCERLGETKVATLDRRDFAVVRPRHCEALRLLPD